MNLLLLALLAAPQVSVQVKKQGLEVRWGKERQAVSFAKARDADAAPGRSLFLGTVDAAKAERVVVKGPSAWIVVDVVGASRIPAMAASYCGAGTEHAKLWFHFGPAHRPPQVVLVESCFENLERAEPGEALAAFTSLRTTATPDGGADTERVTTQVSFDEARPEEGLQLRTSTP
jgi:hypothetical protein